MGLQLPKRAQNMRARVGTMAMVSAGLLLLGACSTEDRDQIGRLAMPEPATDRAPLIDELWRWSWLAAILVGILVWGLILFAVFKYRRRSDDEVPIQTRYNLPVEIFYTIFPIIMVVVFFAHTVRVQNTMLEMVDDPAASLAASAAGRGEGGTDQSWTTRPVRGGVLPARVSRRS